MDFTGETSNLCQGVKAVPDLIEALQNNYRKTSPSPETSYGELSKSDRAEEIRRNLSYAFTVVGKAAVPSLIDAVNHPDWWVRDSAVETLGDIGNDAVESIGTLTKALTDSSLQVRRRASE